MSARIWHRYMWTPASSLSAHADAWLSVVWARLVLVAVLVALLVIVVPAYGAGAAAATTGGRVISVPCARVDSPADRRESLLVVGHRAAEGRFHATTIDRQALLGFG
ncbi:MULTISPECIES: hypothetical protein [Gordonia]|nr:MULTISPECIES: hypothetical protein [Gordonia]MDH3049257.1 methyltransferase [Gordonia alkanivorans]MDJ0006197.1 methyltransferase [Gordonia alkanivorans]MDJ0026904.1 methyltransferase [Gordonia alkanivorans]MDJ0096108.1 methyltransferase [Gordonia alkanivorans]MDJ0491824.1 methyltransferase [Gordonia alkanivorans]